MLAMALLVGASACNGDGDGEALETDGQEQPVMPEQGMDQESMATMQELQQIQQQLQPIQQQALQDEELATQLTSLQDRIEAAMREEDSDAVDRMESLQAEMASAQEAGDQERLQTLMMEGQAIQQEMQALQASVMERPGIRQAADEFEAASRARMIEIDPEAQQLLDRMDELIEDLPR